MKAAGDDSSDLGQGFAVGELLDDAVFQRVKGDDNEASALNQGAVDDFQRAAEGRELVVDGDADGLKNAGGGVDAGFGGDFLCAADEVGEFAGGICGATIFGNGAGDPAGFGLFAEFAEDFFHFGALDGAQPLRGGGSGPVAVHPHVGGAFGAKGKPALQRVHLHAGRAEVKKRAVDVFNVLLLEDSGDIREIAADKTKSGVVAKIRLVGLDFGGFIAVNRNESGCFRHLAEDACGMPAGAEGGVQKNAVLGGVFQQGADGLVAEDGDVRGGNGLGGGFHGNED